MTRISASTPARPGWWLSVVAGAIAERSDAPTATTVSGATLLIGAVWIAYRLRVIARQEAAGSVSVPGPETFR